MTIVWDNIEFTGPHSLSSCEMPESSGVYAIMTQSSPNRYTVIYFGESSNFNERINSSHEKYDCWKSKSGSKWGIYFGLHVMPNSTVEQRRRLESRLIQNLSPSCNA